MRRDRKSSTRSAPTSPSRGSAERMGAPRKRLILSWGGIPKAKVLQVLKPHIFFDDKIDNLEESADTVPCVYIPASE